jgi:hypothetical protein
LEEESAITASEPTHAGRFRAALVAAAALVVLCSAAEPALGDHPGAPASGPLAPPGKIASRAAPPAQAEGCPTAVDAGAFPSASELMRLNRKMGSFGERPTASPAHRKFVNWLARKAAAIPRVEQRSLRYRVNRWLERRSSLAAGPAGELERVPVANAVPYSGRTGPDGVRAPLVYLPEGEEIGAHDVAGKIVVRDAVPGSIPNAVFTALMWSAYDPDLDLTLDPLGTYERDFLGYDGRIDDLRAARTGEAAGLVFVHDFPRAQVKGQYAPYEGERWRVPAVYVGADEGERLKRLAAEGASARLRVFAQSKRVWTRSVITTLPGLSPERIVLASHTDGINALWDNGPIAILALARYFASLPIECRPRTLELGFTTAHLYQQLRPPRRETGAGVYAAELDRGYEEGTVAMVMAMEHMGARQYDAVPRTDGGPGRELVPSELNEPSSFFSGQSPVLVERVTSAIAARDVRRSLVLRGADLPGLRLPPHHSFGGEGTAYHNELIPTVALVTGPWTLFNPAFGIEAIDPELLRKQTLVFADLIESLEAVPRELIAGGYLAEREARELLCSLDSRGFGVVDCTL